MAEGGPARVGVGGALTEPPPTASGIGRFSPNKEGQSCRASVRVCFGEGFLCVRESSPGEKAPRGPIARSSRRQKWIPTCNGNVSHLCLLLDEGGGDGYPASRLDVGLEPLGHPGDPLTADGFPTAWPIPVPEPESNAPAVPVGEGDPASRLGSRPEPRGDGTDVPVGRTSPAPRLDAVLQPGWHRRGPPRAKDQAEGGKKSPEPSGVLRQMLEELERGHVLSKPGEDHQGSVYEFFRRDSDVAGEGPTSVHSPQSTASLFCPPDVRKRCMIGTAATVISVPLGILLCCVVIRCRQRKRQQ
ncbi:uncharacterized protein M6G45_010217 [Spheniscus humboldti]